MYGQETLMLLQHYLELGLGKRAIARQLGVSPRTIHHWIATGQLDRCVDATRLRAKSSGQCATCATVSSTGGRFWATPISPPRRRAR